MELLAVITGVLCIVLLIYLKPSNWIWSAISSLFYGWVFWKARLLGNCFLQLIYFVPISIYGYFNWKKEVVIKPKYRLNSLVDMFLPLIFLIISTLIFGFYLQNAQDPSPYLDSLVVTISILALYYQFKIYVENWYIWIFSDIVIFPILYQQKLYSSIFLYGLFIILNIKGIFEWKKQIEQI